MQMTNGEILTSYKQAKDPKGQVKILAELNACSVTDICDILASFQIDKRTLPYPRKKRKKDEDDTCSMNSQDAGSRYIQDLLKRRKELMKEVVQIDTLLEGLVSMIQEEMKNGA